MIPVEQNTWRPATLALMLAAVLGGCSFIAVEPEAPPPAPPVLPITNGFDQATIWYHTWADEPDVFDGSGIREMMVLFGSQGRDWRGGPGPSGYAVRVVLLEGDHKPIQAPGTLDVVLVANPERPGAAPVMAWSLTGDQTHARFRHGRLPGYMLQLDWGGPPPPTGDYMLIFRWTGRFGRERFTRNVVFQDITRYEPPHRSSP